MKRSNAVLIITRRNSLYDALAQTLSLKEKLIAGSRALNMQYALREVDFDFVSEYLQCTRPVVEAIDLLQEEKTCHYGYLLPTLISTRRKLEAMTQSGILQH